MTVDEQILYGSLGALAGLLLLIALFKDKRLAIIHFVIALLYGSVLLYLFFNAKYGSSLVAFIYLLILIGIHTLIIGSSLSYQRIIRKNKNAPTFGFVLNSVAGILLLSIGIYFRISHLLYGTTFMYLGTSLLGLSGLRLLFGKKQNF